MIMIFTILGLLFLLISPKLFLFLYIIIRYASNLKSIKVWSIFDFLVFSYFSLTMAIMVANRPYYIGKEIGFGEDMLHYYNAFEWVSNTSFIDFFKDFSMVTTLTGASEPLFWLIVKLISIFFQDGYYIHVSITLIGCFLIYLAGQYWHKCGLLFLFLYSNTITFFAFQGSAIRSGLALGFAIFGYVLFFRKKSRFAHLLSPLIHYSMIPVLIIPYLADFNFKDTKKLLKLVFSIIIFTFLFVFFSMRSIDNGLGAKVVARLSENELDFSSIIQFFFESLVFISLVLTIFKNKVEKFLKVSLILFFLISVLLLLLSPTAFSRFYRYEYIFFILTYSSIFFRSSNQFRVLLISISLLWFVFIGFDRFVGVFAENIFDFIGYNLIYRFN